MKGFVTGIKTRSFLGIQQRNDRLFKREEFTLTLTLLKVTFNLSEMNYSSLRPTNHTLAFDRD